MNPSREAGSCGQALVVVGGFFCKSNAQNSAGKKEIKHNIVRLDASHPKRDQKKKKSKKGGKKSSAPDLHLFQPLGLSSILHPPLALEVFTRGIK